MIEWIQDALLTIDLKTVDITFDPHVFERENYRELDLDKIEETVRTGKIFEQKCEEPNKICLKRYYGKENMTYTTILRIHANFVEVKTVWLNNGR